MARGSGCSGQLQGWCTKLVALSSPSSLSLLIQLDGCLHNLLGQSFSWVPCANSLCPSGRWVWLSVGAPFSQVPCPAICCPPGWVGWLRRFGVPRDPSGFLWFHSGPFSQGAGFRNSSARPVLWKAAGQLLERVPPQLRVVPVPCLEWFAPRLGHFFPRTKKTRRVPLGGLVPLELLPLVLAIEVLWLVPPLSVAGFLLLGLPVLVGNIEAHDVPKSFVRLPLSGRAGQLRDLLLGEFTASLLGSSSRKARPSRRWCRGVWCQLGTWCSRSRYGGSSFSLLGHCTCA